MVSQRVTHAEYPAELEDTQAVQVAHYSRNLASAQIFGLRHEHAVVVERKGFHGSKCRSCPSLRVQAERRRSQVDIANKDTERNFWRKHNGNRFRQTEPLASSLDRLISSWG